MILGKNTNTNAKKITPNRDTKALKALIEQKISLELEKTLTNKKEVITNFFDFRFIIFFRKNKKQNLKNQIRDC